MSVIQSGEYVCDRCGAPVGNGGVFFALVVNDLDPSVRGRVRNLHFCREDENNCAAILLSDSNIKYYKENIE